MPRIDALIFDLDNTLWDVGPVILRAERVMAISGAGYPRVIERHRLESMRDLRAAWCSSIRRCATISAGCGTRAAPARARGRLRRGDGGGRLRRVLPRAQRGAALRRRAAGAHDVCVRTAGCSRSATATPTWQRSGSRHFFERSLSARDAGMLKPDPRIFRHLLDEAGLDAGTRRRTSATTRTPTSRARAARACCRLAQSQRPAVARGRPRRRRCTSVRSVNSAPCSRV